MTVESKEILEAKVAMLEEICEKQKKTIELLEKSLEQALRLAAV